MKRAIFVMILVSMMLVACGDSVTGPAQATEILTLPTDDYQIYVSPNVYSYPTNFKVYNQSVRSITVNIYCDNVRVAYTNWVGSGKTKRVVVLTDAWRAADKNGNWIVSVARSGYTQSKKLKWKY